MKCTVLVENNTKNESNLEARFGLGLLFEFGDTRVLVDNGPDETFLANADKMGLDIAGVDLCIITHAHYDHGGGLAAFLERNRAAKVYLSKYAVNEYYSNTRQATEYRYIGLDHHILKHHANRFVFVDGDYSVNKNISTHAILRKKEAFFPHMNQSLFERIEDDYVPDSFNHELAILLRDGECNTIVTGCAHNGLSNMIRVVQSKNNLTAIHAVVGGFHLMNTKTGKMGESEETVKKLAEEVSAFNIGKIYTGHCTGVDGFETFKRFYPGAVENFYTGFIAEW